MLSSRGYVLLPVWVFLTACESQHNNNRFFTNEKDAQIAVTNLKSKESLNLVSVDSIFWGIYFKMTAKSFYDHCNNMYHKGFFNGGFDYKVIVRLKSQFIRPVIIKFYPVFQNLRIQKMLCSFTYENADIFKRKDRADILMEKVIPVLFSWYGGNKFIGKPSKNPLKGPEYVKIDANRVIYVSESDNGISVDVIFEDLKPSKG